MVLERDNVGSLEERDGVRETVHWHPQTAANLHRRTNCKWLNAKWQVQQTAEAGAHELIEAAVGQAAMQTG